MLSHTCEKYSCVLAKFMSQVWLNIASMRFSLVMLGGGRGSGFAADELRGFVLAREREALVPR